MIGESELKVFVAGHRGMVGSAIVRRLHALGYKNVVTCTRRELDLSSQRHVNEFFAANRFDRVYLAAAKVGGIYANQTYPADFIYENLVIQTNVIEAARQSGIGRLLFLGSSCIYPKLAVQPIRESELLSGRLEPTNEPYAIAKIAGIKLCESYRRQYGCDFRSLMPTNLYGPNDRFDEMNSHVLPALLLRFHRAVADGADSVSVWGSGRPRREFLHVDDLATASVHMMELPSGRWERVCGLGVSHVNIGTGADISISELAELIADVVGFRGRISFDASKPDGTPRKLLDVSLAADLGWTAKISLMDGVESTYRWFVDAQK